MGKWRDFTGFLTRYERFLFLLAVLAMTHEVFSNSWLSNEDSPAHLYNSIVARELFLHPQSSLGNVFELNHAIVPNCLGHLILAVLTAFFSLEHADKIFHLITILGMCFSFRFLIRQINPEQPFYSWLIFPFINIGTFYLGFYNFTLGVVLFFLTTAAWMWAEKKTHRIWPMVLVAVLSILLFLTHLIPFVLFIFVAGANILIRFFRKEFRIAFINIGLLFLVIFPALILFIKYFTRRTAAIRDLYYWADSGETFDSFIRLSHLAIHKMEQAPYALFLSVFLLLMMCVSIFIFFWKRKTQTKDEKLRFVFWSACFAFVFTLMFFLPNDFGGSGALVYRLIEISWIFLLLFLAAGKLPKIIVGIMAIVSLSIGIILIQIKTDTMSNLNEFSKKAMGISNSITENSTGVYIPIASNWLLLHVGELAFAEKKSAMLSNYETTHDFFPLLWKKTFPYNYTIGGLASEDIPCTNCFWPAQRDKPEKQIDYVLICKEDVQDSSCYNRLCDTLAKKYVLKKTEEPFYLYQSKESAAENR